MRRTLTLFIVLASLMLPTSSAVAEYQRPGTTSRASLADDGSQSEYPPDELWFGGYNAGAQSPQISNNGRFVALDSPATNLVPGDTNLANDVFVRDLATGATDIVSIASDGSRGVGGCGLINGNSSGAELASISTNGRYVAFESCFTNLVAGPLPLVPGDTNFVEDIFVHDRRTGRTERVSVSSDQDESNAGSFNPSISANGRHITFASTASNLVRGDTNGREDIFVHDRKTHTTERVSVSSNGTETEFDLGASGTGSCPSISGNGRFIAFSSGADNLVEADTNNVLDVFVHDRKKHKTTRVSIASDGSEAGLGLGGSQICARGERHMATRVLSADGRFVVFRSLATNLVPNDSNNNPAYGTDIFVHDRTTGRTERISVTSAGEPIDSESGDAGISADGRFVVFASTAPFQRGDTGDSPFFVAPGDYDMFVHDRATGAIDWVSINSDGEQATHCYPDHTGGFFVPTEDDPEASESFDGSISSDGRYAAFTSCADNLVRDDTDGFRDVFVRDRGLPLAAGGFGGPPPGRSPPDDDRICIEGICIPPEAQTSTRDPAQDVDKTLAEQGADLYGASLAYRPQYGDLFAAIELEHMPKVIPGISPIFYGLRFRVEDHIYEVRATSLLGGTFGLFECTDSPTCTKVADLRGGYGTTGMRAVFSLPLEKIGLEKGGKLSDVTAFSALGSYLTGTIEILDSLRIK